MITASAKQFEAIVGAIIRAGGSDEREAHLVASNLVGANLAGHDSHGIGLVPRYVEGLEAGALKPNQHVTVTRDTGSTLTFDGNRGYGQVIAYEAMEQAARRARETGVVVAAMRNVSHLGRIGHWAEQCAREGLVSIHFVNVLVRPIVAPFGGRAARFGTNPFTVGIPRRGTDPILLDFATSRIAQGKVRVAYQRGKTLPEGAMLDAQGEPTTDPKHGVAKPYGALLPFGEHKGYALAFVCEILAGALAGGGTLQDAREQERGIINGMLSIVIDPDRAGSAEILQRELEGFVDFLMQSPVAGGVDKIRVPGDFEVESRREREANGIPLEDSTWRDIIAAGVRLGLSEKELAL
ncbi:MAG: malate/lactate/ureidoglycolate dehydrogenase [Candidatus Rokubacteria bacterium]|nr:malate/lactate/ureidoglycolate dehydrogenase [Candidatus Rokubacteria bacterium]